MALPQDDPRADAAPAEPEGFELELDLEAARVAWLRTALFAPRVLEMLDSGAGAEDLSRWRPSMEQAVESGAVFSAGVPRTPAEPLANVPQAYFGSVVLLTDGRVYSAADRFAAQFQDHEVGVVLGVDANTGAGGANVWKHADLIRSMTGLADSPYRSLPAGTDITVAIRRTLRVGANIGAPVEDFGVEPRHVHPMTRSDVLDSGADLFARAARLLSEAGPPRRFEVELDESADGVTARLQVRNVDRADFYTDGRPRESVDLADGATSTVIPEAGTSGEVQVEGFAAGRPVGVRSFRRDQQGRLVPVSTFTP